MRAIDWVFWAAVAGVVGCGGEGTAATWTDDGGARSADAAGTTADGAGPEPTGSFGDGGNPDAPGPACDVPAIPAGPEATLAPAYASVYRAFDLGPVPGITGRLGGCVIKHDDPNTLLIAGNSEAATGAIYAIKVKRSACGHILGWDGAATLYATTPYVDANLIYGKANLLFYSQWPVYKLSQLPTGASAPARDTDLKALGMIGGGAGGIGFVPPGLAAQGELRAVTWPDGLWYHVGLGADGPLFNVTTLSKTVTLSNGPGGFAYVPAGSPGFPTQRMIVAEWSPNGTTNDHVSTYEVDAQGDPIVATRAEFFMTFPRPWGAYFEPVTGDFLFLTWGKSPERVFIVQGFAKPPPPPR